MEEAGTRAHGRQGPEAAATGRQDTETPARGREDAGVPPDRLAAHLRNLLGVWPSSAPVEVVAHPRRDEPGWDGRLRPLLGVGNTRGVVLSVAPRYADDVRRLVQDARVEHLLGTTRAGAAVGRPGHRLGRGVFRFAQSVPPASALADAGVWVPSDDPRIAAWLHPFNGGVLATFSSDGRFEAGVGVKRHDDVGREIAVGTEPHARGRGLATRLVAQAARRFLREGLAVTYLHDAANGASARVADAAGFPDVGWSVYGLFAED